MTPLWNTPGELLVATARSILGQTLRNIEWIIVDDGSTERSTLDTLAALVGDRSEASDTQTGPRTRVVRHDHNRGLPAARNTGVAHARAPLVFFLDADDLIEPTTLEKCAWYLHTHPEASFVKGFSVGFGGQQYLWSRGFEEEHAFLAQNQVDTTAMIRRDLHQTLGGHDESLRTGPDDWDFWLKAATAGHWGATIPEYLDWYRRRAAGAAGWNTVDRAQRRSWFVAEARRRYPALYIDEASGAGFRAAIARRFDRASDQVPSPLRIENDLSHAAIELCGIDPITRRVPGSRTDARHALVVVDRFDANADDGVCPRRLEHLIHAGWHVTVVATEPGARVLPQMTAPPATNGTIARASASAEGISADPHPDLAVICRRTPDVFIAQNYVPADEVERFVSYLASSRRVEQVIQGLPPVLRRIDDQPRFGASTRDCCVSAA